MSKGGDAEAYARSQKSKKDETYVRNIEFMTSRRAKIFFRIASELGDATLPGLFDVMGSVSFDLNAFRGGLTR